MINILDTVSTFIYFLVMLLSTDILIEQRIGQITMDLLFLSDSRTKQIDNQ